MPSPGPTYDMAARQVRMGDVLVVDEVPHAVVFVTWAGTDVRLALDDGTSWVGNRDTRLDVTRPFDRHAVAGPHDAVVEVNPLDEHPHVEPGAGHVRIID